MEAAMNRPIKHPAKAIGMLDPGRIYTARGLLEHAGIGQQTLREMRKSVRPFQVGRLKWYAGDEVIAWMKGRTKATEDETIQSPKA